MKNYIKRFLYWSFVNGFTVTYGALSIGTVGLMNGMTWGEPVAPEMMRFLGWYVILFSAFLAWLMEDPNNDNTNTVTRDPGL